MNMIRKILKLFFSNLFIILMLYSGFANSQSDDFGEKLLKMNQLKTAKNYFLKKLMEKPNEASAWAYLGETYLKLENSDSAAFCFQKSILINPFDINGNIGMASIQLEKANITEAKKILEKVNAQAKYRNVYVLSSIADALINTKNKQFDLALEYLQKAKDVDITKSIIHIVSGDLNSMQSNLGEAANDYERAFYYDKNCIDAYYKLGKIYATARNFDQSIIAFESALKIDSTYIPVWRDLAEIYYSYGHYQKASDAFSKYIQLTEADLNDHIRFATILYFNKEYSKSLKETDNALLKDANNFVMKRLNAYNLYETKDYTKGLVSINDYLNTTAENKIISTDYEYYGKLLSKNNQDSMAIHAFEKCIAMDSTKKNLYENIGLSSDKLKKYDKAVMAYENLISSKKTTLSSEYLLLGKSAYFMGGSLINPLDSVLKKEYLLKADTSFTKVTELSSTFFVGYFWKARVNSLLDPETESGLAKPWYEKTVAILELTPDKNKKELMESYQYLGYFYYLKKDYEISKSYWNKILAIDPADRKALDAIKGMK